MTHGWVTLEGEVELDSHRTDTERAVRQLTGVRGVVNRIAVPSASLDARDLRGISERHPRETRGS